jgi:Mce-associated membrane protein
MTEHDGAAEKAESVDTAEVVAADSTADELSAEEIQDIDGQDVDDDDAEDVADQGTGKLARQWFSGTRGLIAAGVAAIVALVGLSGWLGFRVHEDHQAQARRNLYVQVARQTAINLTTISYTDIDADIKRVLDSATGAFHEEFRTGRNHSPRSSKRCNRKRRAPSPRRGCSPIRKTKRKCSSR